MELKVRAIDVIEPKSVQEVEKELLEQHEQSLNQEVEVEPVVQAAATSGRGSCLFAIQEGNRSWI